MFKMNLSKNVEKRGTLIAIEGLDKSGKTTQCKNLVDTLIKEDYDTVEMSFPNRGTKIGDLLDDYLTKKINMDNKAVTMLFSANRWEFVEEILEHLNNGTNVVMDRYAYSGVAYSASKEGLNYQWCRQLDVGLPRPDQVFFLEIQPETAALRAGYGIDRYEDIDTQYAALTNYTKMWENSWVPIDSTVDEKLVAAAIYKMAKAIIATPKSDVLKLWTSNKPNLWTSNKREGEDYGGRHRKHMAVHFSDEKAYLPSRGYTWDAGIDFRALCDTVCEPNTVTMVDTGVIPSIPQGCVMMLESKSGLVQRRITIVAGGVIDSYYTKPLKVMLLNFGPAYTINAGDAIAQGVIYQCKTPDIEMIFKTGAPDEEEGQRNGNGFGSTDQNPKITFKEYCESNAINLN